MKKRNYTISVYWDKRYFNTKTEMAPIRLNVNIGRNQFKMSLYLYSSNEVFEKATKINGGTQEVKELRREINGYIDKAETILERLPNPTREVFQRLFKSETDLFTKSKTDAAFFFEREVEICFKEGRIKSGYHYQHALKSFKRYKNTLYFEDIEETWLKGYMNWMVEQGNSRTTAQMYLRNLRAMFNKAIKEGFISEKHYPFKLYTIGASRKSKDVLYPHQIKALSEYQPTTLKENRAKAYWFFCYFSNGMNFKDACYLKYKNIKADNIKFVREKTKNTNVIADKEITVYLRDELKSIIEIWGNKSRDKEDYIFPIIKDSKTMLQNEGYRKNHQRLINRMLNGIGEKLGFEVRLNLNLARHTFATMLKINETPTAYITDALGHSNSKTTEHYLKSIPDEVYKTISETLSKF